MVSRSSGRAKKLPTGTKVSFTQDVTDGDIQKGDVGTLRVERQTLPRGRGVISTYFVDFDDDTSIEVEGDTTFWVAEEAPSVIERRRELHTKISQVGRKVGSRLGQIGKAIGSAGLAAGVSAGKVAGPQIARAARSYEGVGGPPLVRSSRAPRSSTRAARPSASSTSRGKDPWYGSGEFSSPLEGSPGGSETQARPPVETSQWRSPLEETHRVSFDGVAGVPKKENDPWYGTGEYKSPVG